MSSLTALSGFGDLRKGESPDVLRDVKPVGYHAWVDADHLALFVLGQPATFVLPSSHTGAAEIAASDMAVPCIASRFAPGEFHSVKGIVGWYSVRTDRHRQQGDHPARATAGRQQRP